MRPILTTILAFPLIAGAAPRAELVCPLVSADLVQVDGLLDDWEGMRALTRSSGDPRDSGLSLRCAYDASTLWLAIDVTDDRLIRRKARGKSEDRLGLSFGESRLWIAPSSDAVKLEVSWERTRATPRLPDVADSLQKRGWSVELALPLAAAPGWARGVPSLPFALSHHDADMLTGSEPSTETATGELLLTFEVAARTLRGFLEQARLRPSDVVYDALADMDGEPGRERVIVAGKLIAVLSDGYAYVGLPLASPRDLLGVELVDLAGNGKASAVVRYREHGGGGSRDVLAVFNLLPGGFTRTFAHEIAKQVGSARMENRWELRPRKGRGERGRDLVITPGAVTGFSAETWNETPAEDMAPILLPWGEKRQEVWTFDGDQVSGG
jgi:hypothetical protein